MVLSQMASTTARPQSSCRCCRSHPPARREGEDGLSYKDDGPCEHCSWYTPAPHLPTGLQPPHIIRYILCNGVMMPLCYLQPPAPPPPPPPPPHYRDFVDLPTLPVRRIHPDYIMPRHVERRARRGFQQPPQACQRMAPDTCEETRHEPWTAAAGDRARRRRRAHRPGMRRATGVRASTSMVAASMTRASCTEMTSPLSRTAATARSRRVPCRARRRPRASQHR